MRIQFFYYAPESRVCTLPRTGCVRIRFSNNQSFSIDTSQIRRSRNIMPIAWLRYGMKNDLAPNATRRRVIQRAGKHAGKSAVARETSAKTWRAWRPWWRCRQSVTERRDKSVARISDRPPANGHLHVDRPTKTGSRATNRSCAQTTPNIRWFGQCV